MRSQLQWQAENSFATFFPSRHLSWATNFLAICLASEKIRTLFREEPPTGPARYAMFSRWDPREETFFI